MDEKQKPRLPRGLSVAVPSGTPDNQVELPPQKGLADHFETGRASRLAPRPR